MRRRPVGSGTRVFSVALSRGYGPVTLSVKLPLAPL